VGPHIGHLLSFSIEDDFTGLRTIELRVVILRPGLYVVEFSGSG